MPMSAASGMQEALREVVGKEIMVVVISQCESLTFLPPFYPFIRSATGSSCNAAFDFDTSGISKLMIRRRTSCVPTIHPRSSPP